MRTGTDAIRAADFTRAFFLGSSAAEGMSNLLGSTLSENASYLSTRRGPRSTGRIKVVRRHLLAVEQAGHKTKKLTYVADMDGDPSLRKGILTS